MGSRPAVLVVEDEPLILMDVADTLIARGFTVYEAPNAARAISILSGHPEIGILLTDIDMPGDMNGLRLAAEVRGRWPSMTILITSGHRRAEQGELPVRSRFVAKPFEIAVVEQHLLEMAA